VPYPLGLSSRAVAFALLLLAALLGGGASPARAQLAGIGPGAIAAVIRDGKGKPLEGAHVVASGPASREADTGPSGYVALQALPLGTYTLRVERGGYDPLERTVVVSSAVSAGWKVLALKLAPLSFSTLRAPPGSTILTQSIVNNDPNVAHQLATVPGVTLVPSVSPQAGGVSLDGTDPQDARFALDGIPLAGGGSQAALRTRNALTLAAIAVAPGGFGADGLSLRSAIGGTVNYQTAPIGSTQDLTLGAGYDSNFGSYQELTYGHSAGPLGYSFETVTGSGDNRTQVLKAAYNASSATTVDLAVYGSQTSANPSAGLPAVNSPAYALGLSSSVDTGTFRLRTYGSSLGDERIRGNQFAYDVPVAGELISIGYDRSTDTLAEGAASLAQTTSSFLVRGEAPLTKALRFSVADVLSSGTGLPGRSDPQFGLAYRPAGAFTLQASAGSTYAMQPLVPSSPVRQPTASGPETAFAYHLSAGAQLTSLDAVSLNAFRIDQANRYASLSQARSSGVNLGFSHTAGTTGLSFAASANLLRSYAYGNAQPAWRYASTADFNAMGAQFAGMPYSSGRFQFAYQRQGGLAVVVGTSYYGANNGLGPNATTLTDVGVGVPVGSLFNAQFGVRNLFGSVPPPSAAYLYGGPGELTFSLGRSLGR
jgi:hypothetical protein